MRRRGGYQCVTSVTPVARCRCLHNQVEREKLGCMALLRLLPILAPGEPAATPDACRFPRDVRNLIPASSAAMKISNHSAVPVYTISGSSTARPLPEWLARKRKRSLKNDSEYATRIELLQDFEFEEASQCVRVSDDGQWIMSTGINTVSSCPSVKFVPRALHQRGDSSTD